MSFCVLEFSISLTKASFSFIQNLCQEHRLHSFLVPCSAAPAQSLFLEHQSRQTLGHTTCPGGEFRPALHGPKPFTFFFFFNRVYRILCTFPNWVCKAFPNLVLACFHPHLYTSVVCRTNSPAKHPPKPSPRPQTHHRVTVSDHYSLLSEPLLMIFLLKSTL